VEAASKGKIGYLHLRAMGPRDIASFARDFYANVNREGLVIDVRRNNGGNIDSWIIEKLLRKAWAFWAPPGKQPRRTCRTPSVATWWCWSMNDLLGRRDLRGRHQGAGTGAAGRQAHRRRRRLAQR
jgi:hypothetical protein